MSIHNHLLEAIDIMSMEKGIDFLSFQIPYLEGNVIRRISDLNLSDISEYKSYLSKHPEEVNFFYYQYLYQLQKSSISEYLMPLLPSVLRDYCKGKSKGEFKVWMPMASSNESVFVIASALQELKEDGIVSNFHIYVTHPVQAEIGKLRSRGLSELPSRKFTEDWVSKYFVRQEEGIWKFRSDLKMNTVYAKHDFLEDNPIKSLDLLLLNGNLNLFSEFQKNHILKLIYDCLKSDGIILASPSLRDRKGFRDLFLPLLDSDRSMYHTKKKGLVRVYKNPVYSPFNLLEIREETSENKLRLSFFQKEGIAFLLLDQDGFLIEFSHNLKDSLKIREGSVFRNLEDVFSNEVGGLLRNLLSESTNKNKSIRKSIHLNDPYFSGKFNQVSIHSVEYNKNKENHYVIYLWRSTPSTEKEAEEHYQRVIREIHHRVKNQMAIIFSFLELERSASDQDAVQNVLNRMIFRIHAIEIIQNFLSENPFDSEIELSSCIESYVGHWNAQLFQHQIQLPIEFIFDSRAIYVLPKQASPILLCLSEILSHFLQIISHNHTGKESVEINCKKEGQSVGLSLKLIHQNRDNPWKELGSLEKAFLDANAKQLSGLWEAKTKPDSLQYILRIPSL